MVGKGARDMTDLSGHTVFDSLARTSARLERSVRLASGLSAAMWSRDEIGSTRYAEPSHHTLSLYLSGGEGFRLRGPRAVQPSLGAGSVCVMPKGITTDWDVRGAVSLFHLYVSPEAFDRAVIETLDRDPARLELRPLVYLREPLIEGMIRAGVLGLGWDEPGERVALSYAMQALLAAQLVRVSATDRPHDAAPPAPHRGGLSRMALKRVQELVEARLAEALTIETLAAEAGLSPFHFARAFRTSTGESPHRYVLMRRIEAARSMIDAGEALSQVALRCGFVGQSHFTARFRELVGVTPGRYRQSRGA